MTIAQSLLREFDEEMAATLPNTKAVLQLFDKNSAEARQAILAAPDTEFARPWAFKVQGKVISNDPKAHVYRRSVMNHLVHHRAQLGVYLRLVGVPVPAIYGPSADERGM